jgi:hypothetical protein
MAAGNAVVATDVGQTRQIVDQSVGYCVSPDAGALAAAIDGLLADPDRARQLGTAARLRVIEGYSPGPYVERLLGIYESAIRRRGRVQPRQPRRDGAGGAARLARRITLPVSQPRAPGAGSAPRARRSVQPAQASCTFTARSPRAGVLR